ncbi:MAG: hypothetical protein E7056_01170 [Lentisphaerae bacterium]|nr:hypothetical protein [Lentisphaerota bacterium]
MKKYLFLLAVGLLLSGCATRPEYFEELTAAEQTQLVNSARTLALQGKAVPDHLRGVFAEVVPYQRIVYEGNKRGRATFRWEIYESPADSSRLTQKDINPYWVMVYATGDLTDPDWKLAHANENPNLPGPEEIRRMQRQKQMQHQSAAPDAGSSRPVRQVRYKR